MVLNFKMEDQTYRPSGSGSSGGHSSGSASSGITTRGKKTADVQAPKGSVTGVWVQDGSGRWIFTSGGRTYAGEWAYIHNPYASEGQESTSWFRFSSDGAMVTGWFQDPADGNWYYLHDISDGSLGRMYTGWHRIGGIWYCLWPQRQDADRMELDQRKVLLPGAGKRQDAVGCSDARRVYGGQLRSLDRKRKGTGPGKGSGGGPVGRSQQTVFWPGDQERTWI